MPPRRASLPEGKSLFFRHQPDEVPPPDGEPASTDAPTVAAAKGPTRQSAIFLEERHLDWLEDKCREARRRGGRAIRKAVIIRSLLDIAMESPIDLTTIRDDDEVLDRIRQGLRRPT
jgi:hypothetical protein